MATSTERLRPQDVVLAISLHALQSDDISHAAVARLLSLPRQRVHESIARLQDNGLYSVRRQAINVLWLREFLEQGLRWLCPARPGAPTRGIPTAHAGPVLRDSIVSQEAFVWPSDTPNAIPGRAVEPIHPLALIAAREIPAAYPLLSLADAFRVGRTREQALAHGALVERLA